MLSVGGHSVRKKYIRMIIGLMLVFMMLMSACGRQSASSSAGNDENKGSESVAEGSEEAESVLEVTMMANGRGVAVTQLDTVTEDSLKTLKDAGITFVKVHIPYPFDADGNPSSNYLTAKRAVKLIASCGLEPVMQSFTPGGNAFNSKTNQVEWISYLPNVFEDYDDEYFYKVVDQGCKFIGKDLAEYGNCWIISNEPNIVSFTGPMTLEQIKNYIFTSAEAVKEGNPCAYCGVNIFGSADKNTAMHLITKLYAEDTCLDYLGLDSYFGTLVAGGAEDWDNYIDSYYNAAKVPIMITEFSYSSYTYNEADRQNDSHGLNYNSPVCRDKKFSFEWEDHERSEETQKEYAEICLDIFRDHPEVIGWCWFSNIDKDGPCWECGDEKCPMESSWGLLRADGTPKPVLDIIGKYR